MPYSQVRLVPEQRTEVEIAFFSKLSQPSMQAPSMPAMQLQSRRARAAGLSDSPDDGTLWSDRQKGQAEYAVTGKKWKRGMTEDYPEAADDLFDRVGNVGIYSVFVDHRAGRCPKCRRT
jgi:hypothetical protein